MSIKTALESSREKTQIVRLGWNKGVFTETPCIMPKGLEGLIVKPTDDPGIVTIFGLNSQLYTKAVQIHGNRITGRKEGSTHFKVRPYNKEYKIDFWRDVGNYTRLLFYFGLNGEY